MISLPSCITYLLITYKYENYTYALQQQSNSYAIPSIELYIYENSVYLNQTHSIISTLNDTHTKYNSQTFFVPVFILSMFRLIFGFTGLIIFINYSVNNKYTYIPHRTCTPRDKYVCSLICLLITIPIIGLSIMSVFYNSHDPVLNQSHQLHTVIFIINDNGCVNDIYYNNYIIDNIYCCIYLFNYSY